MTASSPKESALLGFDPFNSISRPGHSDLNSDFTEDGEEEHLPQWATEWEDKNEGARGCEEGEECEAGVVNPLGALGKWVMVKTAPHYNTLKDQHLRHSCNGLPGWALEECMQVRAHEKGLDAAGHELPAEEENENGKDEEGGEHADEEEGGGGSSEEAAAEKARPAMLHSVRRHPAVWAALPARNARVAQGQRWAMH